MERLEQRIAVVTGAGSGIGRAVALRLADRGCHLALLDRSADGLRGTEAEAARWGRTVSTHVVDVGDAEAMVEVAAAVADRHGGCHILVNNAGVTSAGSFRDEPLADLRWIVDVNLWGVVHGCRAFLPLLEAADEGHIVNMSSMVGLLGLPHNASYSLTKGAVRSFSEALRAELITSSIGVTVVFPGAVHTAITEGARGAEGQRLARLGRSRVAPLALRSPDAVARRIVAAIDHDRARIVVGPDARAVDVAARLLPGRSGLVGRLTNRVLARSGSRRDRSEVGA